MVKRFLKSFRYGQKGFTLLELLIVIGILGVLAVVVVPNVGRFMEAGRKAAAQQELGTVQTAIDAAMAEVGLSSAPLNEKPGVDDYSVGPVEVDDPLFTGADGSQVNLKEYLRRGIEGEWTFGSDGLIISGKFPSSSPVWYYSSTDGWSKTAP